jgi:GDP/UDP-N,N'-diacetylbacillosamine 2-epimerase (hydrolysing)
MKIGILTSSRADFGIYLPLLKVLQGEAHVTLEIIAFGTHLSVFHGYTHTEIQAYSFPVVHQINTVVAHDDANAIATSYGLTVLKFAEFWNQHTYGYVICLGDRYEMSAAVQAGIPFRVRFVHLYGGETTLGAIDNIYRDQISLASSLHITATPQYKDRVEKLFDYPVPVYALGSISLDELSHFTPVPRVELEAQFKLPQTPYLLVTFHPETLHPEDNVHHIAAMETALEVLAREIPIVVTMPNADTQGSAYRKALIALEQRANGALVLVENFGKNNYFSAIHYCALMLGNTSSGIVETASFGKYTINVGNRQQGRAQSANTFNVPFDAPAIIELTRSVLQKGTYKGINCYQGKNVAQQIFQILEAHEKN